MALKYPRYWTKLPRVKFADRAAQRPKTWLDEKAARRAIESIYGPGWTIEPFIQLVRETSEEWEVIAEWQPSERRWLDPLVAALCG